MEKGVFEKAAEKFYEALKLSEIHDCEEDRNKTGKEILLKYIHDSGGPYWPHADNEADHKRYDSVCKRLWKLVKYG